MSKSTRSHTTQRYQHTKFQLPKSTLRCHQKKSTFHSELGSKVTSPFIQESYLEFFRRIYWNKRIRSLVRLIFWRLCSSVVLKRIWASAHLNILNILQKSAFLYFHVAFFGALEFELINEYQGGARTHTKTNLAALDKALKTIIRFLKWWISHKIIWFFEQN